MKVLVGMSGGIDSTAVCMMLKEQGHTVLGLTIRNNDVGMADGDDEPPYIIEARKLAGKLGVDHYVADERARFDTTVVAPFVQAWMDGLTPNPCVCCNPLFKFKILLEWADRLDCDMIATGHYARVEKIGGTYFVSRGTDAFKDQSYFLWKLPADVLSRTLFPLGTMTKKDVRNWLSERGMEAGVPKKESMEICFIEDDYRNFLRRQLPDIDAIVGQGKYVDSEGHVLGTHQGYPFYTVGQRKGLKIAFGEPRYVLRTNPAKNTVMLGLEKDLDADCMLVTDPVFTASAHGELPHGQIDVMIRYHSRPVPCTIENIPDTELFLVRFAKTVQAVTPGQYAVFYEGDRVIGGASIASQRGINQYK